MHNYEFNKVSIRNYIKSVSKSTIFKNAENREFSKLLKSTKFTPVELTFQISLALDITPSLFEKFVELYFYIADLCQSDNRDDSYFRIMVDEICKETGSKSAQFVIMWRFFFNRILTLPFIMQENRENIVKIYRSNYSSAMAKRIVFNAIRKN